MKQKHIKSQTTTCLYQHPTAENTVKYKTKSGLIFPSIIMILVFAIGSLYSCSEEQAYQSAVVVKHLDAKMGVPK